MLNFIFHKQQKKRIFNNLVSRINSNFFLILSQILFPSLMIMTWGVDNFGIWMFLISVPYSISILNVDLVTPITNKMSFYYNKNRSNELSNIYSNFLFIVLFNLIISILLIGLILFSFDFNLKIFNDLSINQIRISLAAITFSFTFFLLNSIFFVKINYRGKGYISNNIIIFFDLVIKIALVVSFFFSKNFIILPLIFISFNMLKTLILYVYSTNSKIEFDVKYFNFKKIKSLIIESAGHIVELINTIIKNNFQIILVGLFFSPAIVGMLSTCRTLFYFLPSRLLSIIFTISEYEIIETYSKKKFKTLNKNLKIFWSVFLISSIFIFLFLYFFGLDIYNIWTQNNFEISFILIGLILFDTFVVKINEFFYLVDKSLNKFFKISLINSFITIISTMLIYFYLNLNYSYIIIFMINLFGSLLLLVILNFYPTIFKKIRKL